MLSVMKIMVANAALCANAIQVVNFKNYIKAKKAGASLSPFKRLRKQVSFGSSKSPSSAGSRVAPVEYKPIGDAKFLLVGDSGVGKTALAQRFVNDKVEVYNTPTYSVDLNIKRTNIDDQNVKLQVWDTSGNHTFKAITTQYYRGASAIFIVFDVTNQQSFDNVLNEWHPKMMKEFTNEEFMRLNVMLVANKCDLKKQRVVSTQEAQDLADTFRMEYFEVSAKKGTNVKESFEDAYHALGYQAH